jgi:hypothetical protein
MQLFPDLKTKVPQHDPKKYKTYDAAVFSEFFGRQYKPYNDLAKKPGQRPEFV